MEHRLINGWMSIHFYKITSHLLVYVKSEMFEDIFYCQNQKEKESKTLEFLVHELQNVCNIFLCRWYNYPEVSVTQQTRHLPGDRLMCQLSNELTCPLGPYGKHSKNSRL